MPEATLSILIRARDEATRTLQEVGNATENLSKQFKIAGGIMIGAGAAILGGLVMAAKAAGEEQAGIERLNIAMRNVGLSYNESKESLEGWIDAQMRSTAFADEEQRAALSQLVVVTHDLTQAQGLLTTAMDLARWKNIDLSTAVDVVTKVYAGNMGTLSRYGIVVRDGASATEALAAVQSMASGQAKAFGQTFQGAYQIMKNSIDNLKETVGTVLLPIFIPIIEKVTSFVNALRGIPPELMQLVTTGALATGAMLSLSGVILLFLGYLPKLQAGLAALHGSALFANIGIGTLSLGTLGMAGVVTGAVAAVAGLTWYLYNEAKQAHDTATSLRDVELAHAGLKDSTDSITPAIGLAGKNILDLARAANTASGATKELTKDIGAMGTMGEATKVAIGTATEVIDGVTYRTNLYTEAEIKLAEAAGKKVDRMKLQNDTLDDATKILKDTGAATDALKDKETSLSDAFKKIADDAAKATAQLDDYLDRLHRVGSPEYEVLQKQNREQDLAMHVGAGQNVPEIMQEWRARFGNGPIGLTKGEYYAQGTDPAMLQAFIEWMGTFLEKYSPSFQQGGIMPYTGLAHLERGESVLPANAEIVIHNVITLDGRTVAESINRHMAKQLKLQGY